MDLYPHKHILARLAEDVPGDFHSPQYGAAEKVGAGDSSVTPSVPKKEGDEFQPTGEERREVALADKILAAAAKMARTPDVEAIVRYADELKKMHGKS